MGSKCTSCSASGLRGRVDQDQGLRGEVDQDQSKTRLLSTEKSEKKSNFSFFFVLFVKNNKGSYIINPDCSKVC